MKFQFPLNLDLPPQNLKFYKFKAKKIALNKDGGDPIGSRSGKQKKPSHNLMNHGGVDYIWKESKLQYISFISANKSQLSCHSSDTNLHPY